MSARAKYLVVAAAVLAISVLVVLGSLASSTTYNYCVGHKGQYVTGSIDQSGAPVVKSGIDNPTPINLFIYCGGIYANENGSGITALATILLTILTGILGYLAWDQGRTSRAQLRAYVFVTCNDTNPQFDAEKGISLWLTIKNTGQTPAYKVKQWLTVDILSDTKNGPFYIPQLDGRDSEAALGPNAEFPIRAFHPPLTTAQVDGVVKQSLTICIWGEVSYEDVFRNSRFCKFRFLIPQDKDGRIRGVKFAEKGNEAN